MTAPTELLSTTDANQRQRVLVVEDEPMVAEVVERYLRRDGYDVRVVHDGGIAVAPSPSSHPTLSCST